MSRTPASIKFNQDSGIFSGGEYAKQAASTPRHETTTRSEHAKIDQKEYVDAHQRVASKPHAPPIGQKEFRDPDAKSFTGTRSTQPFHTGDSRSQPTQRFNADHAPLNHGWETDYKSTTHKDHKAVPHQVVVEAASSVHAKPKGVSLEITVDSVEPLSTTAKSHFTPKQSPRSPTAYTSGQESGQFGHGMNTDYKSTTHKEHGEVPHEIIVEAAQSVHSKKKPGPVPDLPPVSTGPFLSTAQSEYTAKSSPREPRAFTMNQETHADGLLATGIKADMSSTTRSTFTAHPTEEYQAHVKPQPSPRKR